MIHIHPVKILLMKIVHLNQVNIMSYLNGSSVQHVKLNMNKDGVTQVNMNGS